MMSCVVARTGRQRQRYEDQLRLVAGCIPFRLENRCCNLENRLLVLMISSPNRDDLVFPKGGWEDDETMGEAACREALEEAGVKGILGENPLGFWEFRSKSRQNSSSMEGGCRGYMFALEVTEELDSWPEQANHDRKWVSMQYSIQKGSNLGDDYSHLIKLMTVSYFPWVTPQLIGLNQNLTTDDAFKYCRYDWMREALQKFLSADRANRTGNVELSTMSVPDARAEHQMLAPGCCGKPLLGSNTLKSPVVNALCRVDLSCRITSG